MRVRAVLLKVHLYMGLVGAIFLVILGLTGSVMAFENDIDHWLHPALFYVMPGPRALPEQALIRAAEQRFAPARAASVQVFRAANLARVVQMTVQTPGGLKVFVNPYAGSVLGSV